MITGISSGSGYPSAFITSVRARPERPAVVEKPDANPSDLAAPSGDQAALSHEFTMLDLATRQFGRILPAIEAATNPVE